MSNYQVANTILQQLGGHRFIVMTGAHTLAEIDKGLSFRISSRMTKNKANAIKIVLDPSDTYTVKFIKLSKTKMTVVEEYSDVYCDSLQRIFTDATGMYTSL